MRSRNPIVLTKAYLTQRYVNEGWTTPMIAEEMGVSITKVRYWLTKFGIGIRNHKKAALVMLDHHRERKPSLPRVLSGKGYSQVLRRNHPRADSRGYVWEHLIVWEAYHGRPLPLGFVIHHINGDKLDNRPENLRAFSKSQHSKFHVFARLVCGTGRDHAPQDRLEECLEAWDRRDFYQLKFDFYYDLIINEMETGRAVA